MSEAKHTTITEQNLREQAEELLEFAESQCIEANPAATCLVYRRSATGRCLASEKGACADWLMIKKAREAMTLWSQAAQTTADRDAAMDALLKQPKTLEAL